MFINLLKKISRKQILPLLLMIMLIVPLVLPFAMQAQATESSDIPEIVTVEVAEIPAERGNIALRRPAYASLYQQIPANVGNSASNSSWTDTGSGATLPSYDETAQLITDGINHVSNPLPYPTIRGERIDGTTTGITGAPAGMINGRGDSSGTVTYTGTLSDAAPVVIRLTLSEPAKVAYYNLLPNNGNYTIANAPHTWRLEGSKTGTGDWVVIDRFASSINGNTTATIPISPILRTTTPFNGMDIRYLDVSNINGIYSYSGHSQGNGGIQRPTTAEEEYQHYRLVITRRHGGTAAGTISLADIALFTEDLTRNLMRAPFISRWTSTASAQQWVYVDLGEQVSYDNLKLHWGNSNYPTAYTVQVSNDVYFNHGNGGTSTNDGTVYPNTWTTISTQTRTSGGIHDITFEPQTARYLRVNMTTRAAGSSDYKLYELEVYGTRSAPAYQNPPRPAPDVNGKQNLTGGDWTIARGEFMTQTGEQLSSATFDDSSWIPAQVPGTALMSYVSAGILSNPKIDMDMMFVSDTYFYSDWWYRTSFEVPANKAGQRVFINFDGINWKSKVFVNGQAISNDKYDTEGSFMRHKFDVTDFVTAGTKNYIAVRVFPNESYGAPRTKTYSAPGSNGGLLGADNPTFHASIHWDWVPTIRGRNVGIYDDVFVTYSGTVQLVDPWVVTEFPKLRQFGGTHLMSQIHTLGNFDDPAYDLTLAQTVFKTEVKNTTDAPVEAVVSGTYRPGNIPFSRTVTIPAGATIDVDIPVEIRNPDIWWPNGYGGQPLYTADVRVSVGGSIMDEYSFRFGVRKLEYTYTGSASLYTQAGTFDSREGFDTSFNVWCNGVRIYKRGGNWGMDCTNVNLRAEDYRVRLKLHAEQNFTMIRNWVGMTMKSEFYEAADEYGILIFDDFWLANPWDGPDPLSNEMFLRNAEDKIRIVRRHASMAIYCTRNEMIVPRPLDNGLQDAITKLDGTRAYIRASDASVWGITGHGDYSAVERKAFYNGAGQTGTGSRRPGSSLQLNTERGQHVIANPESLEKYFRPENLWPGFSSSSTVAHPFQRNIVAANVWGVHDFFFGGNGPANSHLTQLNAYASMADLSSRFDSVEGFSRVSQLVNYDLYKAMFEAHTDIKSAGLLTWMSQSAWPSFAWRTYDYFYDTSAAYFGNKRACSPLSIIWNPTNTAPVTTFNNSANSGVLGTNGRAYNPFPGGISVANNTGRVIENLTARANIYNLDGTHAKEVQLLNGGKIDVLSVDTVLRLNTEGNGSLWNTGTVSPVRFIKLELFDASGKLVAENFYWRSNMETGSTATGASPANYYRAMLDMPRVTLRADATAAGSDAMSNYYDIRIMNPSPNIAIQTRIKATDPATGDMILPVFYEDNYINLLPGETKIVSVDIEKLYFNGIPEFSICGFNVNDIPVHIMPDPRPAHEATIKEFTFGGQTFVMEPDVYEYNVNLPVGATSVSFSAADIVLDYPDDVNVDVVLSGTVPCVATITIECKLYPASIRHVYKVNFSPMTAAITAAYTERGWTANADVKFGDGITEFEMIFALYDKDGRLVFDQSFYSGAIPVNADGLISFTIPKYEIEAFGDDVMMKVFLWDATSLKPLSNEWSSLKSGQLVPVQVYRLVESAADIKAGEEYVFVSAATGTINRALINTSAFGAPVGCMNATAAVTVSGAYITSVVHPDMVWEASAGIVGGLRFMNRSGVEYYGGAQQFLSIQGGTVNPVRLSTTVPAADPAFDRWSFTDVSAANNTVAMHTTASTADAYYVFGPHEFDNAGAPDLGFMASYGETGQEIAFAARALRVYVQTIEMKLGD